MSRYGMPSRKMLTFLNENPGSTAREISEHLFEGLLLGLHGLAQLLGLGQALLMAEPFRPGLELVDGVHLRTEKLDHALIARAEDSLQKASGPVTEVAQLVGY